MGLVPQTGIAETGVVAMLEGEEPGPVVLLRLIWMLYRLRRQRVRVCIRIPWQDARLRA
jgi:hypothetical protein